MIPFIPKIKTNRDLYRYIISFDERYKDNYPPLQNYLHSLWDIARHYKNRIITFQNFAIMLNDAFIHPILPFNESWLNINEPDYDDDYENPFDHWENSIQFQIADLYRMKQNGQLDDQYKYFGITSPSGSSWYNFDPFSFLECAALGSYGGYEEEDETRINLIEDDSTYDGQFEEDDPKIFNLGDFDWEQFADFLYTGQIYE